MTSANSSSGSETKSSEPILSVPPISNQVFKLSNKVYIGNLSDHKKSIVLDCAEGYWEFHKFEHLSKCFCCHYLGKKLLRKTNTETERSQLKYFHRFNGEDIKTIHSTEGIIGIFDDAVMTKYRGLCHQGNNPLYTVDMMNREVTPSLYKEGVILHLPLNKSWTVHVIYDDDIINCIQIFGADFNFPGEYHDESNSRSLKSIVEAMSLETSWDAERTAELQKFDNVYDRAKLEQMRKARDSLQKLDCEGFKLTHVPEDKDNCFVIRNRTVLGIAGADSYHLKPIDEKMVDILQTKYGYLYHFTEEGCDLFHNDDEKLNNVNSLPVLAILPSPLSDSSMSHETSFRSDASLPTITSTRTEFKIVATGYGRCVGETKKVINIIDLITEDQGGYGLIDDPKYGRCVITTDKLPIKCIGQLPKNMDARNLSPDFYKHLDPLTPQMIAELTNIYGL